MMKNVSNETVEEASVMSGAEGARRRRTPRRGRGSTRDERRVGQQVKSERRFTHAMTRKRQRWQPPRAAAASAEGARTRRTRGSA